MEELTQCGDFESVNSDPNCSWDLDELTKNIKIKGTAVKTSDYDE